MENRCSICGSLMDRFWQLETDQICRGCKKKDEKRKREFVIDRMVDREGNEAVLIGGRLFRITR